MRGKLLPSSSFPKMPFPASYTILRGRQTSDHKARSNYTSYLSQTICFHHHSPALLRKKRLHLSSYSSPKLSRHFTPFHCVPYQKSFNRCYGFYLQKHSEVILSISPISCREIVSRGFLRQPSLWYLILLLYFFLITIIHKYN